MPKDRRVASTGWVSSWGPYWFPMLAFLALLSISRYLPEAAAPWLFLLRVAVPGCLLLWYAWRGCYPELRGAPFTPGGVTLDVCVGLLGAALWIAPFVLAPSLRPENSGFDRGVFGVSSQWFALLIRGAGFAVVTPFIEELFVRSWMLRYVDVFEGSRDFRSVPIGRFTWRSFLVVTVYFVFSHVQWEWGVMLAWTLLTMSWLYHRRHIAPLILVHAVTNAAIFFFVLLSDGRFVSADGQPLAFWFFL
ncbi:MAG: CAAX prenyl protease-related protein [Myxococcales bacterium]|nr:CAAX prenyl protease-related protein [Myxococcales bacterium]MDH5306598.1 CAAX prenyl protease-related protein [Myxococcales bacterium]MDH5567629.1 CAAX prenyl protease-related protein [Myxococcales bacterium]